MLDLLSVQTVEIVVGIAVAVILIGGFGAYIGYRVWAKKHGKSACDGNCAHCGGCHLNLPHDDKQNSGEPERDKKDNDSESGKLS